MSVLSIVKFNSTKFILPLSLTTLLVVAVGFVFPSFSAAVAPNTGYATYTAAVPNGAAGTVSMTAGFGNISYTSQGSSGITIPGGTSAIQPLTTPFAAFIGLSSFGQQYINTRMNNSAVATNIYIFSQNTPNNGKWGFSFGDIDAEKLVITAIKTGGASATAVELGFQAKYNYNDPSDTTVSDLTVTTTANSVELEDTNCPTSCDTVGISAWFKPSVSLQSLTVVATGKSGFPIYQTWFATQFKPVKGDVIPFQGTPAVNPTPIPPLNLDLVDKASGAVIAETTSNESGTYQFPAVYPAGSGTYEIEATGPYGEVIVGPNSNGNFDVPAITQTDIPNLTPLDVGFDITAPAEYEVSGTVTNLQDQASGFDVQVVDQNNTVITQTDVQPDGTFVIPFVPPSNSLALVVVGPNGETSQSTTLNTISGNVSGVQLIAPGLLAKTGVPDAALPWLMSMAFILLIVGAASVVLAREIKKRRK